MATVEFYNRLVTSTFSGFYLLFTELNHPYRFLPCLHSQLDGEDPINCKKVYWLLSGVD